MTQHLNSPQHLFTSKSKYKQRSSTATDGRLPESLILSMMATHGYTMLLQCIISWNRRTKQKNKKKQKACKCKCKRINVYTIWGVQCNIQALQGT